MKVLIKALLFLFGFGIATFAQVNVSLPDTTGQYQTTIDIPVYTSDLTGHNVTSYNFKVEFDGSILEAQDVNVAGTLSDRITWTVTPTIKKNSIEVTADGIFSLSGDGVLVYLTFNVVAQSGETALTFDNFTFNNGTPTANTTDGYFTVDSKATLNLTSGGDGEGQVYVNGTLVNLPYTAQYPLGEMVELYAEPAVSSDFTGWTGDIQTLENPVFVTMDSDKSITANFTLKEFTISTSSNPPEGGTTTGGGVYKYGTQVTVTATPAEGWEFINWTENGIEVSNQPSYTFTADSDRNLIANFQKKIYTVQTSPNPPEGGSTTGDGQYEHGSQVTVIATPNDIYTFKYWTENNVIVSTDSLYTFVITADRNLVANFEKKKYTVQTSTNPVDGGTTTGDGQYEHGTEATVTATPNEGYRFVNWTENNEIVSTTQQYSFIVTSDRNLVANFEKLKYTVITSANPNEGGTTSGDGEYFYGDNVTVIATPNTGYEFLNWTEDNIVVSTSQQFIFTINRNRNLVANFRRIKYTVHTDARPQNGGSTSGDGEYFHGETVTVTATPNFRFVFENWTENNTIVSTSPQYTFTIENDRNLVANFEIKAFTIAANVIPPDGGVVEGTGNYKYGETAVLKATAAYGFKFVEWREDGNPVSTDSILTFSVESNRTFDAVFTERNFTITCVAFPADGGITSGCGIFKYRQNANLKAYANPGWKFVNWTSSDGSVLSTQSEFNLTVSQSLTVSANFDEEFYTLSCKANPPDAGFTSGCGIFKYGQTAQLKAIPNDNWKFDYWSNSTGDTISVDSSFVYFVEAEEELIANFSTLTGIKNLDFENGIPTGYFVSNNYPNPFNPSTIIKFGLPSASIVSLNIFDVTGKLVRKLLDSEQLSAGVYKFNFEARDLPSGIYFYRVQAFSNEDKNSFIVTRKMILLK